MDASLLVAIATGLLVVLVLKWVSAGGKKPPGPWGLPILGYLPFLSDKPHLDLQRLAKKYGNVFSIRLGNAYVVVLNDFKSSREAFSQDVFIGRPPDFAFDVNKENVETGAFFGLPWKELRRFCLHTFRDLGLGKSKLEEHLREELKELLKEFERHVDKPFAVRDQLTSSLSNNIATLVSGKQYKYDDPVRKMLIKAVNDTNMAAGQTSWKLFFPLFKNVFKFLGIGDVDKISRISKELRNHILKEIDEHEKTLNPAQPRDFIDVYLLEIEKRKDDPIFIKPILQDMVHAFFGAGSETVRLSIEWMLLIAATYKDAQCRIHAEIDGVIGRDRLPNWLDQKNMPYTQAFIMEMMRWRCIVPLNLLRYTLADTELCGFFIPKHTQVLSNLWAIHYDAEFWGDDVEEFRPDRFLTEGGKAVKKLDLYIPFSMGKRSCPGESFAKIETFLYLVAILQKFNVSLPDDKIADFEGNLGLTLVPKLQDIVFTKRH